MSKRTSEAFDAESFETRLEALKDTQEGIQKMSSWCLHQRAHHKKIVASWLNVFKRVHVEHRLTLFYLANDVIQYSKRRRYEYVESWATALQKATTMVRDGKVKNKILRIFNIWEQRRIYSEEYLSDLCGLLNITPLKKHPNITIQSGDYQNHVLIARIRDCVELSEITDKSFKKLPKNPDYDIENIKQQLKDRNHSDDIEKQIKRYIDYTEEFNKNLHTEIKSRKTVIANLEAALKFYSKQKNEVKVVVSAYKNFGSRVKLVKKKIGEILPNLPSPIPSPDIDAPSPEPDADIHLPGDQSPVNSANAMKNTINGYSSYLDGNLPFDINDFNRKDTKIANQISDTNACNSEKEGSFHTNRLDYYENHPINTYGLNNIQIPGLTALPIPDVPTGGYSSLARTAQQFTDVLSSPSNPPLFGIASSKVKSNTNLDQINSNYAISGSYNSNNSYDPNTYDNSRVSTAGGSASGGSNMQSLMPPPPIPTTVGSLNALGLLVGNDNLNTNWGDINWSTPLDNVSAPESNSYGQDLLETPASPPHFEQKARNSSSASLEYSEHNSHMSNVQDVDLRQLHLPAFGITDKMCISKEKSRQLEIDHRNLIPLTGSPRVNENDKKSWLSSASVDEFQSLKCEDVDYRTLGQNNKTIETTNLSTTATEISESNASSISSTTKNVIQSPNQKNINVTAVSDTKGNDVDVSGGMGYDPTDMVVDMDMSDDDLDDIVREVNEQTNKQNSPIEDDVGNMSTYHSDSIQTAEVGHLRNIPLLETPTEYGPSKVWEASGNTTSDAGYTNSSVMENWRIEMSWVNNAEHNNLSGHSHAAAPSPPRQPYPHLSPYAYAHSNDNVAADSFGNPNIGIGRSGTYDGRDSGRTWGNLSYRPYLPRQLRGGVAVAGAAVANNPANMAYYRGGVHLNNSNNMQRGNAFRGKFRGKANWK